VQFVIDAANVGSPLVLSGGIASLVVTTLAAGTHQISAIYTTDSPNAFQNSQTNAPIPQVVAPAPLTVTADNQTRVYGAADPAFTASYSGFVNGETLASSGVSGSPSLTSNDTAASPVGAYTIQAALGR
jgi:hypothetical protein